MRDSVTKKFHKVQASEPFHPYVGSGNEFVYWHDPAIKSFFGDFGRRWSMENRLSTAIVAEMHLAKGSEVEQFADLHMVLSAFLEGEPKTWAEIAEIIDESSS